MGQRRRTRRRLGIGAAAVLVAAGVLLALGPLEAGGGGDVLRWRFEGGDGYAYRLGGADAAQVLPDGLTERTLYPADLRDEREPACPAGRVEDLIFLYAFALPAEAVAAGTTWPVRDLHAETPAYLGTIVAEGEGRCLGRKGETKMRRLCYKR